MQSFNEWQESLNWPSTPRTWPADDKDGKMPSIFSSRVEQEIKEALDRYAKGDKKEVISNLHGLRNELELEIDKILIDVKKIQSTINSLLWGKEV